MRFPLEPSSASRGIGLLALREHTRALGGICDISRVGAMVSGYVFNSTLEGE